MNAVSDYDKEYTKLCAKLGDQVLKRDAAQDSINQIRVQISKLADQKRKFEEDLKAVETLRAYEQQKDHERS